MPMYFYDFEGDAPKTVGGEVTNEKLVYELPELFVVPVVKDSIITGVSDTAPSQQDAAEVAFLVDKPELYPIPVEFLYLSGSVTATELVPEALDTNSVIVLTGKDVVPNQTSLSFVQADYNLFANAVASSNTWENTTDALADTTATAAKLEATASNVAGIDNETSTGDMIVAFRDIDLGDLAITSSLILSVETGHATAGIPTAASTTSVVFQYSLNSAAFVTFHAQTINTAKAVNTVDLTSAIGTSVSAINSLRVRATGSITSGTGVGVSSAVSFYRTWLSFTSEKDYTQ